MKYFVILFGFLILVGFFVIPSINDVYGLWMSQTPEKLFEQSETVFVGTVTSVNVLEFERSNTRHIEENGIPRIEIENYTQTLDEYTVDIEEFLKNSQGSNTITMLEATVGGVPGRSVSIGGFELDDRVLFYVPIIDGINQYSPESFKIPKQCDATSVLEQPKITLANDFKMIQDGISLNDNFTANKPIQFIYNKDMRTLEGKIFDVEITISKIINNDKEIVIKENIHTESKPCEWISTASWEFVPTVGKYSMRMYTSEGNSTGGATSSGSFTVIEDGLCDLGSYFEKGLCVIIDDSTNTPVPSCKSGPRPDGEGWVLVDCNWEQYADVSVDSCEKGITPANNYAWNSQDCLWEWSPMRNENATGPTMNQNLTNDAICGNGTELVDGTCQVIKTEKIKIIGDDAPFFGIFAYLDDLFLWIFGK